MRPGYGAPTVPASAAPWTNASQLSADQTGSHMPAPSSRSAPVTRSIRRTVGTTTSPSFTSSTGAGRALRARSRTDPYATNRPSRETLGYCEQSSPLQIGISGRSGYAPLVARPEATYGTFGASTRSVTVIGDIGTRGVSGVLIGVAVGSGATGSGTASGVSAGTAEGSVGRVVSVGLAPAALGATFGARLATDGTLEHARELAMTSRPIAARIVR